MIFTQKGEDRLNWKKIEEIVDNKKLAKIRELRSGIVGGEPDVFLYRESGEMLFLEVKKESDRVSEEQLKCLAQIREVLGADVGIVYLKEETRNYSPKTYNLNTEKYTTKSDNL